MLITSRPRRLRSSEAIRNLISETHLCVNDLIAPLFIIAGDNKKEEITSMPGQYRFSLDLILQHIEELTALGIKAIALFPALDDSIKTHDAKESYNPEGLYLKSIRAIKKDFPHLLIMSDVALDPYSSDGHDGLVVDGKIINDESVKILCKMALEQARAGADIIGPSDMMDSRVGEIRKTLEENGFIDTIIMSYSAKYASAFYGPFRDALDSAPKAGDKKTYQMDYANSLEALREGRLDEQEGADILMVKPGISYLDIIVRLKDQSDLPIAAYNVSGEYAMVKAAAQKGWINETQVIEEMLTSFKRAGADIILTYFAMDMAKILKNR